MNYGITEKQINKIVKRWGNDFYLKVLREIEIYSEKWGLSDFEFVEYYSFNAIFYCKSILYGDCVLKIYSENCEYDTLREYNGVCFTKVFECAENNVMLMERIIPGKMLKEEQPLEKRLAVFLEVFCGLHIEPKNPEIYGSYTDWVFHGIEYLKTHEECAELYSYMLKAEKIYLQILLPVYNKKLLLHGDLHYNNILLNSDGKYKIIDPFGFIGDPIFEIGRYMSVEYGDKSENRFETVIKMIEYFEKSLNIPNMTLKQCFYVEIVACKCYRVAHGDTIDLDDIKFAETILHE